jgi:hypothetical protein
MSTQNQKFTSKRSKTRRLEDRMVRDQIQQHKMLFELGQMITSEMDLDALFKFNHGADQSVYEYRNVFGVHA